MAKFDHLNVMKLLGVVVSKNETLFIVMPFMAQGSLLSYLRNHRADFTVDNEDVTGHVSIIKFIFPLQIILKMWIIVHADYWYLHKASFNMFTNCKGNGLSSKPSLYTSRPCSKKLHVSNYCLLIIILAYSLYLLGLMIIMWSRLLILVWQRMSIPNTTSDKGDMEKMRRLLWNCQWDGWLWRAWMMESSLKKLMWYFIEVHTYMHCKIFFL